MNRSTTLGSSTSLAGGHFGGRPGGLWRWRTCTAFVTSGRYAVEIGMYDPESMERLPVYDAQGALQGDTILLKSVNVAQ